MEQKNEYEYGELRKCGNFLSMFPNPLILYKGSNLNLLERVRIVVTIKKQKELNQISYDIKYYIVCD